MPTYTPDNEEIPLKFQWENAIIDNMKKFKLSGVETKILWALSRHVRWTDRSNKPGERLLETWVAPKRLSDSTGIKIPHVKAALRTLREEAGLIETVDRRGGDESAIRKIVFPLPMAGRLSKKIRKREALKKPRTDSVPGTDSVPAPGTDSESNRTDSVPAPGTDSVTQTVHLTANGTMKEQLSPASRADESLFGSDQSPTPPTPKAPTEEAGGRLELEGKPRSLHVRARDFWMLKYREKYGRKYPFGSRDGAIIKEFLEKVDHDPRLGAKVMLQYLKDDEKFVADRKHSLNLLIGRVPGYMGNDPADPDDAPADPESIAQMSAESRYERELLKESDHAAWEEAERQDREDRERMIQLGAVYLEPDEKHLQHERRVNEILQGWRERDAESPAKQALSETMPTRYPYRVGLKAESTEPENPLLEGLEDIELPEGVSLSRIDLDR